MEITFFCKNDAECKLLMEALGMAFYRIKNINYKRFLPYFKVNTIYFNRIKTFSSTNPFSLILKVSFPNVYYPWV